MGKARAGGERRVSTSNIELLRVVPAAAGEVVCSRFAFHIEAKVACGAEHRTLNVERRTSNAEHRTAELFGDVTLRRSMFDVRRSMLKLSSVPPSPDSASTHPRIQVRHLPASLARDG